MRKKILIGLSVLAAVFCTLYSCIQEDFANKEAASERNAAEFFKHAKTHGAHARAGINYVDILENYNRENNFLAQMPDQQGMPIWDKMQVLDNAEKTVLYIPLSADKTGLSSLLIVKVDEKNTVFHLQNFTNDYLKEYVYNTDYPAKRRKLLMDTFLQMDFFTFGHQEFTNLPKDLYEGSLEYNRLSILDAKIGTEQNKGFIYNTICSTYHYCVHGHSASNCDYGNCSCGGFISCFVVTSCSTTATWIDDPFPSFPGGGGGGGGGGGIPGPQPPKDPCAEAKVFYRIAPGCGGNGGSNTDSDFDDLPCEKIISENAKAKNLLNQSVIAAQNAIMKTGISASTIEKGFIFGKDTSGSYKTSDIILGDSSGAQVDLPPIDTNHVFTAEGGIHNHTIKVYEVPSTGDIYWFMQNNYQNSNFDYYIINGAEGATYACVITNQADFDNFPLSHPPSQYFSSEDNAWNLTKDIGKDFDLSEKYFKDTGKSDEEAKELAMAFVIGKYNMGMGLSKKDSNGNFQPIFVKENEIQVPTGDPAFPFIVVTTYEKTTDCNLK
ncbi:hypothetical protein SD427_01035 [Chryseobacterium sp. JJR-5R]|uniref:hypothetical protein n=1 Tax=Chryseobacterium sp. JJR-5R TaxID=3093923 RepID=UPI002A7557AE|nr:hypothetical protein [Chryseobacterium sp. JJR-5R]WPO82957.1 hypothetical protein SD427_01035 [Chryseobacterium sp. JJR-5R]